MLAKCLCPHPCGAALRFAKEHRLSFSFFLGPWEIWHHTSAGNPILEPVNASYTFVPARAKSRAPRCEGGGKKLIFASFSFSFFWQDTGKQRGLLRATCSGRIVGKHFRTLNSWSGAAEANGPEGVFFSDWGSGRLRGSRKQKMRSSRPLDRGRDFERRGFFSLMDSRAVCMKYINAPRYIRSQSLSTCCLQKASLVLFPIWLFLGQLDRPFSYTHIVHDPWREPAFRFTAAPPKHKQTSPGFCGLRIYAHRPVSLCHGSLAPSVAGQLTCKTHSSVSAAWQSHKNIHGTLRSS